MQLSTLGPPIIRSWLLVVLAPLSTFDGSPVRRGNEKPLFPLGAVVGVTAYADEQLFRWRWLVETLCGSALQTVFFYFSPISGMAHARSP